MLRRQMKALGHEHDQAPHVVHLQRVLWEHIRDAVIISDEAFIITAWNAGAERLYGWKADEVVGQSGTSILKTEFPGVDKAQILTQIREVGYFRGDATQSRKDGTRIHVEVDCMVLRDRQGQVSGYLSVNHDISQRKLSEEQTIQSERFLRTIADGVPGLIAYWSRDLRCEFANACYLEWFGRTPTEMIGKHMRDLLGEEVYRWNEPYIQGALRGERQAFERTLKSPDGTVRQTWVQFVPDVSDGMVRGFFVLVSDITAQKKVEGYLHKTLAVQRALADNAAHAIISTDATGLILSWNPSAERMLGYAAREMVEEQRLTVIHDSEELKARAMLFSAEIGQEISADFEVLSAKARLGKPNEHEWIYVRKDGARLPVLLGITALRDDEGEITGYLGLAADLTTQKRMETELRQAKEVAERASQTKSEFLATMSHEIRTPLNGVLGMTHLLLDSPLGTEQRNMVELMRRSGDILLHIINDILDYSKIEAGKLDVEIVAFPIHAVIDEVLELMRFQAMEKGLELLAPITVTPGQVRADVDRTRQILLNLIGNAIKFTRVGSVTVTTAIDEGMMKIVVSDTGIGIAADKKHRIFKRFTQADTSTTRHFGGTGLGLTISARLAALLDGAVGFESEEGRGSTFWVKLPLASKEATTSSVPPATQPAVSVSQLGLRVVLAEDNLVNQKMAEAFLKKLGCRVDLANNGEEAVRLAKKGGHDVVLMDCQMPEMDGFTATREIRQWEQAAAAQSDDRAASPRPKPLFVIAITAGAMTDERERCFAAGMDAFLAKPFNLDQLASLLAHGAPKRATE